MKTECTPTQLEFHALGRREVMGKFDGGSITSDAGGLLLREAEQRTRIIAGFARCFEDKRNPEAIEHTVAELVAQRIYGLALGYEDLNDHDDLRRDPLFAVLVEKEDPEGEKRIRPQDRGKAAAGKSTLAARTRPTSLPGMPGFGKRRGLPFSPLVPEFDWCDRPRRFQRCARYHNLEESGPYPWKP